MTIIEGNLTPEPRTGLSIEDVKRDLPDVRISTGLGMIANGQLSGRDNDFATVHYCASLGLGVRAKVEFSWETVTRAINNGTPLRLG